MEITFTLDLCGIKMIKLQPVTQFHIYQTKGDKQIVELSRAQLQHLRGTFSSPFNFFFSPKKQSIHIWILLPLKPLH